jgi:uncharacterized protein (DUF58 family)
MRTVRLRHWFADFAALSDYDSPHRKYLYYSRRRVLNPALFFFAVLLGSLCLALVSRAGLVLAISQLVFMGYLFFSTYAVARGLQLRRIVPSKASENEEIEIRFEIDNPSAFAACDLLVSDRYEGSRAREETVWLSEPIRPFRTFCGRYRKTCDAGMGTFRYGPMTVRVADPFGIFQFLVEQDDPQGTEIYPFVNPLEDLPIRGSKESFTYGIYDVASRGLSSNFIGVRDYERGDSLRHVSWKLSLKARRLLVKEFEKSVNTEITLILDMTGHAHMGWKSESTWEYAKDIALSIVSREMANGNHIQLVANRCLIPAAGGEHHYLQIIKSVFDLFPEEGTSSAELVSRAASAVRRGTTAVYIGPVFKDFEGTSASLIRLAEQGVDVIAVLLDAGTFVRGKVHGTVKIAIETMCTVSQGNLTEAATKLSQAGAIVYVIEKGADIGKAMLRPRGVR